MFHQQESDGCSSRNSSTWNRDESLSGLVDVPLLDSTGEAVSVSLLHRHAAADTIEVIRTSEGLWRSSREQLPLSVQPQQLRLRVPASGLTVKKHCAAGQVEAC